MFARNDHIHTLVQWSSDWKSTKFMQLSLSRDLCHMSSLLTSICFHSPLHFVQWHINGEKCLKLPTQMNYNTNIDAPYIKVCTHTQSHTLKDLWASRAIRLEEVRGCEIAVVWDFLDSHNLHWLQALLFIRVQADGNTQTLMTPTHVSCISGPKTAQIQYLHNIKHAKNAKNYYYICLHSKRLFLI